MVNGIVIMGRTGSSRLENKVQKKIGKTSIIEFVINRAKKAGVDIIILATTISEGDDILQKIAQENQIGVFRGSIEDTLDRLYQAAKSNALDNVILVESDEVFTDPFLLRETVDILDQGEYNCVKLSHAPIGMMHIGMSFETLEKVWNQMPRGNADGWGAKLTEITGINIVELQIPEKLQEVKRLGYRLTLDYPEDYELISKIGDAFIDYEEISYDDLAGFLSKNPELAKINSDMQAKWLKNLNLDDF